MSHFCAEHCCVEHYHHSHDSVCYVLLVVFCCSLYPQQVQTRMKQVDKNKVSKTGKNDSKLIRRASKIEAWGLLGAILAPRQLRTAKMMFLGRSWPPQKEPFWKSFRLMLPSRGALRLKIEDFGGGLVAECFFEEILHHFWRGLGQ